MSWGRVTEKRRLEEKQREEDYTEQRRINKEVVSHLLTYRQPVHSHT